MNADHDYRWARAMLITRFGLEAVESFERKVVARQNRKAFAIPSYVLIDAASLTPRT